LRSIKLLKTNQEWTGNAKSIIITTTHPIPEQVKVNHNLKVDRKMIHRNSISKSVVSKPLSPLSYFQDTREYCWNITYGKEWYWCVGLIHSRRFGVCVCRGIGRDITFMTVRIT
jgi:hypothetical protein